MEYKIKKEEIENIIESETEKAFKVLLLEKNRLKTRILAQEKLLEKRTALLPLNVDLLFKHWDILLETVKSFLLASSTIFVASLALDTSKITNIDILLTLKLSILGLTFSIIAGSYILYKRNQEKEKMIKKLFFLEDGYIELNGINHEVLNIGSSKSFEEVKEKVRLNLRGNKLFNKYLPDDF